MNNEVAKVILYLFNVNKIIDICERKFAHEFDSVEKTMVLLLILIQILQ